MSSETRGSKGAENKFVSWEAHVFWYMFIITKADELFDGSGISSKGGVSPSTLDGARNIVLSASREDQGVVLDVEKGVRFEKWIVLRAVGNWNRSGTGGRLKNLLWECQCGCWVLGRPMTKRLVVTSGREKKRAHSKS